MNYPVRPILPCQTQKKENAAQNILLLLLTEKLASSIHKSVFSNQKKRKL
jgi:hypothetical protein